MSAASENLICFVGQRDPYPEFGITGPSGEQAEGPVLALLNHRRYDEAFLLCHTDNSFERAAGIRLECEKDPDLPKVSIIRIDLEDIINHAEIYRHLVRTVATVRERTAHRNPAWSVLLDPGTPQMQTAWILLVRSGGFDAALVQGIPPKFNNGVYTCRTVDLGDEALPDIVAAGSVTGSAASDATDNLSLGKEEESSKFEAPRPATPGKTDDFKAALTESPLSVNDPTTRAVFQRAWTVAGYDQQHHLILGETGTGKTSLAKWIHRSGPRAEKPFHTINCGTLMESSAESVLFGHVKGAYTGAETARPGALRTADGGVLFLDEIGDLKLDLQTRLLQVLDGDPILPMGSDKPVDVDVVIIAATNIDLSEMVEKGGFRSDLYARLNTVPLTMPPLRDRPGDIEEITRTFVDEWNRKHGENRSLVPESMEILSRYHWPHNIRELKNVLNRTCMLAATDEIVPEDLPEEILRAVGDLRSSRIPGLLLPEGGMKLKEVLAEMEKDIFRQALERAGGVAAHAATLVGMQAPAFRKALRERFPELVS